MNKDVAVIVGVGSATGTSVAQALAGRYQLILIARSAEMIPSLAASLPDTHARLCDVSDRAAWEATLNDIRAQFGTPKRILINTESAAWGSYDQLSLEGLDLSFDVNVISLLQLVQVLFPDPGTIPPESRIMISSSPAAYNPPAQFLGLAPSRVAQRVMAELLHEHLAPNGLAFNVFSINGAIDEPKMRAAYPDQADSFFIQPDDIAREMVRTFDAESFPKRAEIRGESAFA